jgi:hypothetical protein
VGDLLFSLPTICDMIPSTVVGTSKLGMRVLELHEDDWRQIELIAGSQHADVDAGLAAVRAIYDDERVPSGAFRKLHVRKEAANPLPDCNLSIARLCSYFSSLTPLDGIAYRGASGLIEGGFALCGRSGLCLYGIQEGGAVRVLALHPHPARGEIDNDSRSLAALMRDHDLCLVDWCRVYRGRGIDAEVMGYLAQWSPRGDSP